MQVDMETLIELNENIHFRASDTSGNSYFFLVSKEALDDAVGYRAGPGETIDRYSVFINNLDTILDVAAKLIAAKIRSEPLVITTELLNR